MFKKLSIYIIILSLLGGCTPVLRNQEDILKWINNPSNGLIINKQVNQLEIICKYFPPEYLAHKESKSSVEYDSLYRDYKNTITILLTIKPKVEKDIMFYEIHSKEEFDQRFYDLNFNLNEYVYINAGNERIYPALYIMENTYGLSYHRSFNIVFEKVSALQYDKIESLDIVFNDVFFETGITHFKFLTDNIEKFPTIKMYSNHE